MKRGVQCFWSLLSMGDTFQNIFLSLSQETTTCQIGGTDELSITLDCGAPRTEDGSESGVFRTICPHSSLISFHLFSCPFCHQYQIQISNFPLIALNKLGYPPFFIHRPRKALFVLGPLSLIVLFPTYHIYHHNMSKKHLQIPENNIPEVDGALEEDSLVAADNSALVKVKTEESNQQLGNLQSSRVEVVAQDKKLEDVCMPITESVVLGDEVKQSMVDPSSSMVTSGINVSMLNEQIEIDMNQDIGEYFLQYKGKIQVLQQKQHRWIQEVNYKIKKQIKSGGVKVNSAQQQLELKSKNKPSQYHKSIEELESKKHGVIQQLKDIDDLQTKLRIQQKQLRIHSKSKSRLILTEDDRKNLMELVKIKKEFEKSLQKKNAELMEQERAWTEAEKQKMKEKISLENEKKKEKILKKLKELEISFQQRQQGLKKSVLRRRQKYIYKKKEEQWESTKQQQSEEINKKLKALQQRHKLNIDEINQHQKRYSECIEQRASEHLTIEFNKLPKREKTYFDKLVQQQLFQAKENNYKKVIKAFENEFRNKISSFQEKVDKEHKPKVDPSKTVIVPLPRSYSSVCLSKEERVQKGLGYLAKAKQMKKSSSLSIVKAESPPQVYGNKVYKNYMADREKVKQNPLKKQFKQILTNDDQLHSYDKAVRAKNLADGLGAISKREGDKHLYYSMKTKLELLKNLY